MTQNQIEINILEMLKSPDAENHLVGLSIMEKNELITPAFLIIAYSYFKPVKSLWKQHAPNKLSTL